MLPVARMRSKTPFFARELSSKIFFTRSKTNGFHGWLPFQQDISCVNILWWMESSWEELSFDVIGLTKKSIISCAMTAESQTPIPQSVSGAKCPRVQRWKGLLLLLDIGISDANTWYVQDGPHSCTLWHNITPEVLWIVEKARQRSESWGAGESIAVKK